MSIIIIQFLKTSIYYWTKLQITTKEVEPDKVT